MKYLTTEINKKNNAFHVEPLYNPSVSLGDTLYLRVICGNFKPAMLEVMVDGSSFSKKILMKQSLPTVYETRLTKDLFTGVKTDAPTKYNLKFFITYNNLVYEVTSEEFVRIQGLSFTPDHLTDVSELFDRLNTIEDEIRNKL